MNSVLDKSGILAHSSLGSFVCLISYLLGQGSCLIGQTKYLFFGARYQSRNSARSNMCKQPAHSRSGLVGRGGDGILCGVFLPEGGFMPNGFLDVLGLDLDVM